MRSIEVTLQGGTYPVWIGAGVLGRRDLWERFLPGGRILVLSNDQVAPLYLEPVLDALAPRDARSLVLPDGEPSKTIASWSRIIDELIAVKAGRDSAVVALGGGVIGDLGGFAAASYMRGIACVQVPTSLLAQVDAAIGGKTGVNHAQGKNLIGAFHQPVAVLADTATLETLPGREFTAGLAEAVKYGVVRDPGYFGWLESRAGPVRRREPETIAELVQRSVINKADVVAADEREFGVRALLNFGHSFGHALETLTGYESLLHGEAVSIGMVLAAEVSLLQGLCDESTPRRLSGLLSALGLPVSVPADISADAVLECLVLDKKSRQGEPRFVLLTGPGSAVVGQPCRTERLRAAIDRCRA